MTLCKWNATPALRTIIKDKVYLRASNESKPCSPTYWRGTAHRIPINKWFAIIQISRADITRKIFTLTMEHIRNIIACIFVLWIITDEQLLRLTCVFKNLAIKKKCTYFDIHQGTTIAKKQLLSFLSTIFLRSNVFVYLFLGLSKY